MPRIVTVSALALALAATAPLASAAPQAGPAGKRAAKTAAATPAEPGAEVAPAEGSDQVAPAEVGASIALVKGAPVDKANWKQKKTARTFYRAGMKAFSADEYDQAMTAFVASYGAVASPNSHLMVVRTMYAKGEIMAAYGQAQLVVVEAMEAATKNAKYKTTARGAEDLVAEIDAQLTQVTIKVEPLPADGQATLSVNGSLLEKKQWGSAVRLPPGAVVVVLTTALGKTEKTLVAAAGQQHELSIAPATPPPAAAPVVAEASGSLLFKWPGPDRKKIAYISGGVGAVGLLTFGIFGALTSGQAGRLEDGCPDVAHCDPDLESFADRGQAYQVVANTGLVLGIIGLSAGAGFYLWEHYDDGADSVQGPVRPRISQGPRVSLGPGSVSVSGSF
jgi:hypothetical protein